MASFHGTHSHAIPQARPALKGRASPAWPVVSAVLTAAGAPAMMGHYL